MTQLAADQEITLQAFQAAVDTYNQRGLDLPESIAAIANDLESHIDQLDFLSERDPTFEMVYQAVRSNLQSTSSQRAKLLNPPEIIKPQTAPTEEKVHLLGSRQTQPIKAQPHIQPPAPDESPPAPQSLWENFDRIAIMAAGGAFLGAAFVQFLGGGPTQLIGAIVGAIIGLLSGIYVSHNPRPRRNP
jgi:hypothetical protein